MKAKGVFGNQAAGCVGCVGGLGSFQTGVFSGPTALGATFIQHKRQGIFGAFGASDESVEPTEAEYAAANVCNGAGGSYNWDTGECMPGAVDPTPPVTVTPPVTKPPVTYTPPATYVPPATKTPPATTTTGGGTATQFLTSKFAGLPMYAWLGVGGALIGVFFALSRSQSTGYDGYSY